MPANFPEFWLNVVAKILENRDAAPWLDGIAEIDADVSELGAGSASETNIIHVPVDTLNPNVLINNTTYPLAVVNYTDTETTVSLDKYQTEIISLTDDQVIGASTDRIKRATDRLTTNILVKKFSKAAHALCPTSNSASTPVIATSGASTTSQYGGSRNKMTYTDLLAMKSACDRLKMPATGRRLVLCTDHYNDLLEDRQNFGDLMKDYQKGTLTPMVLGFEIYQYSENPVFSSAGSKKAFGAVTATDDRQGSFVFQTSNVVKKTGLTKQYFLASAQNPTGQANQLGYRHYFVCTPAQNKYLVAAY